MEIKLDEREKRKKVEEIERRKKKVRENLDKSKCARNWSCYWVTSKEGGEKKEGAHKTVIGILINTKRMSNQLPSSDDDS